MKLKADTETMVQTGAIKVLKFTVLTDKKNMNPKETNLYKILTSAKVLHGQNSYPSYEAVSNNENKYSFYYEYDTAGKCRYFMQGLNLILEATQKAIKSDDRFRLFEKYNNRIEIEYYGIYNDKKNKYAYETLDGKFLMKSKGKIANDCFDLISKSADAEGIKMVVRKLETRTKQIKLKDVNSKREKWQKSYFYSLPDTIAKETEEAYSILGVVLAFGGPGIVNTINQQINRPDN